MAKDAKGHGSEARSVRAGSYDGKPVFHGVVGGQKVTNSAGNPIAYASPEAAIAGANSVGGPSIRSSDQTSLGGSGEAHVAGIAAQHGVSTGHLAPGGRFDYNPDAVNQAIASSNRAGRRIGGKEASAIHRLLKGRG